MNEHFAKLRRDCEAVLTWDPKAAPSPLDVAHMRRFAKECIFFLDALQHIQNGQLRFDGKYWLCKATDRYYADLEWAVEDLNKWFKNG